MRRRAQLSVFFTLPDSELDFLRIRELRLERDSLERGNMA